MMRCLVTGAAGFLGARLAEALIADGEAVRLSVRDRTRLPANLVAHKDIIESDLADLDTLQSALNGVDVVFHCAANAKAWDSFESYRVANVDGVRNLLETIRLHCPQLKRLVHLSTVDVYGYPKQSCTEDCRLDGAGFGYGETKLAGERLVREYGHAHAIPYTVFRPANIMGPGSSFIAGIGARLQNGVMLKIDGGQANAGVTDVDNLIAYLRWGAAAPVAEGQIYNVRDSYDVSWSNVLDELRRRLNGRGIVVNLPYRLADGLALIIEGAYRRMFPANEPLLHRLLVRMFGRTSGHSAEKIAAHSGLHPKIGFQECMDRSVAWFLTEQASRKVA